MADAPVAEEVKAEPLPKIELGKSLSSQAAKLTKILESTPDKKEEPKEEPQAEDKPEEVVEEPKEDAADPAPPAVEEEETAPVAPVELAPIGKYIMDKLPTRYTQIVDGDSVRTVGWKDTTDLPEGFTLANDAARAQFTADIAAQTNLANDYAKEYKQAELQNQIRAYEIEESRDVAAALKRLQAQKIIPEFKYKEDDPRFNDDPAVKEANAIYEIFKRTNTAYAQKNLKYRVSFEDAADKYYSNQYRTERAKSANDTQKAKEQPKAVKTAAQKERTEIAKQSGGAGGEEAKAPKPAVKSGMSMNDVMRLYRAGRI